MDKKANNAKTKSTKASENKDDNKKKDQKKEKAKTDGEVPKRARSGYNIFCAENKDKVKKDNPNAPGKDMLAVNCLKF
jgi:hypothetical protein